MLSGNPPAVISGNVLTVTGTAAADAITVQYTLSDPGDFPGSGETFAVTVNGATQTLTSTVVTSLVVNSGDGNDSINVSGINSGITTKISLQINSGDGNDTINTTISPGSEVLPTTTVVEVGNGNDNVSIGGGDSASVMASNGNDRIEIDATSLATITAGNGNDFFEANGAVSQVDMTVSAGTGDDLFYNEDPDNSMTATAANGPSFTVSNLSTSATGRAYIDNNRNGVFDAGDAPLASTQVYLDANDDGVYDAGDTATMTNAYGYYALSNIDNVETTGGIIGEGSSVMPPLLVTPPAGYAAVPFTPGLSIDTGSSHVDLAVEPVRLTGTVIGTSGSYQNDGNTIANAFDGNLSTFFDGPTADGNYAGLNLGSADVIASISYAPRAGFAGRMVGGVFQGSNSINFSNPTTLYTISSVPAQGMLTTVDASSKSAFQYVRYVSPVGSYGDVAEVQLFGANPASGQIFVHLLKDVNGTGIPYQNEAGLSGFGTFLDLNHDGIFDGSDVQTITDAAGDAEFSGLAPGTYSLMQNVPAGYAVSSTPQFPLKVTVTAGGVSSVQISETPALTGTLIATSGSYGNGGNTAANALDNNLNTFFDGPTANGNFVGLMPNIIPEPYQLTEIRYAPRPGFSSRMVGGVFQGSNSSNFSSPTTLYTITTAPAQGVLTTVPIGSRGNYEYFRYLSPAGSYGDVAEVEFFGYIAGSFPTPLTGTPIGTAGSYANSGNTIAKAFDGNLVTYFDGPDPTGDWVGLDLGTAQVATSVQYSPRPGFKSRMLGGEIQASNTANFSTGVVTLATIATSPTPGVLNTLSPSNSVAYEYYRYIGPANSYRDIAELVFLG